jgi:hypothetical protein
MDTGPGEGDASTVCFHVRYFRSGDGSLHEEICHVLKDERGTWDMKECERPDSSWKKN